MESPTPRTSNFFGIANDETFLSDSWTSRFIIVGEKKKLDVGVGVPFSLFPFPRCAWMWRKEREEKDFSTKEKRHKVPEPKVRGVVSLCL